MRTPPEIGVLIVEDHPNTRTSLALALRAFGDLEVLGQVASGEEALAWLVIRQPDVVLLDLRLPGMDGLATLQVIAALYPQVRVLALSSSPDADLITATLEAGAAGYLLKDVSARELAAAIRTAEAGVPVLSATVTEVLAQARTLGGGGRDGRSVRAPRYSAPKSRAACAASG